MSKQKTIVRRLLTARLISAGVEKNAAHHEVGFLLNRCKSDDVVAAIMLHATGNDPISSVRNRLNVVSGACL